MTTPSYALLLHGGAGDWRDAPEAPILEGLRRALKIGRALLAEGGGALDAVTAAVAALEDDPLFNAGTGSVLNLEGEAEMDAQVMAGEGLRCGGVAAIRRVRNPVLVARAVMEESGHCLLAGEGALRFARALGFADHDPVTPGRRAKWQARRAAALADPAQPLARLSPLYDAGGTVGAVALDLNGRLAAATSTGGITLKLPGRVGDSAVPGAGNYATRAAAASATGHGELMLRALAAKAVCDRIAAGVDPQGAVQGVLADMAITLGNEAGLIALDRAGRIGIAHGTPAMPHAWASGERPEGAAAMRSD